MNKYNFYRKAFSFTVFKEVMQIVGRKSREWHSLEYVVTNLALLRVQSPLNNLMWRHIEISEGEPAENCAGMLLLGEQVPWESHQVLFKEEAIKLHTGT